MKKQTVMFTALPNGFSSVSSEVKRLRLSVMISPRLMTDEGLPVPTLSQFPDWLSWQNVALNFTVRFNGGPAVPATVVSSVSPLPLWQAVFSSSTYVKPYEFPKLDDRRIRSFPVRHVMGFIKQQYTAIAALKPDQFPNVEQLNGRQSFGQIATWRGRDFDNGIDMEDYLDSQLNAILDKTQAVPPSDTANPIMDFHQVKLFHKPHVHDIKNRPPISIPKYDFHQIVSSLGDYPDLMRRMGLVYDLEVPYSVDLPTAGVVQVIPDWAPALASSTDTCPKTHYMCDGSVRTFMAAPRPSDPELQNGMLDLTDGDGYGLVQVDVDGAALKTLDFANNLARSRSKLSVDTPDNYATPALRSGGISLIRHGRALRLVQMLKLATQRNTQAESNTDVDLYAEDVTRGYRVDIWDSRSQVWNALTRRHGDYKFTNGGILISADDEGTVSMGVTQSPDGSSPDLYLHESMVTWQGWSLAAPRYGKLINNDDAVEQHQSTAGPDYGLAVSFTPQPASLPKLRYGTNYRMRARAVDLAGNSLPYTSRDDSTATSPTKYTRIEPVISPVPILRAPTTIAETIERLVIRSNYNTPYQGPTERHIAPPLSSQLDAETHSMFDVSGALDPAAYALIVARQGFFNPNGTHPEAQLALPYLPDPIARGAALRGLPGMLPTDVTKIAFDGTWPDRQPFRIVIQEGAAAPSWDPNSRVLTVCMAKAEMAPVHISSYLDVGDLDIMSIWQWLTELGFPAATMAAFQNFVTQGGHWMITPYRTLTLVHAVQQPLQTPEYAALQAQKTLGDTFAMCVDAMPIHGKSTNKLDVLATWSEPIDALSDPKWKLVDGNAHVGEMGIEYGDTTASISMKHEFHDTKYRKVTYSAVATSRYKEYFQQAASQTFVLPDGTAQPLGQTDLVEHAETVAMADGSVRFERDVDYTMDYAAGTITKIAGGAIASGASVKVDFYYLPGPVTRETVTPVSVDVLNSARPEAPKLLYIVPTFAWSKEDLKNEGQGSVAIRRNGGGLRIYMDRPWFSSGDGELLGAVLWQQPRGGLIAAPPKSPPEPLKPFVTQWGQDPIWLASPTYAVPALSNFPLAVSNGTNLSLAEVAGALVSVAGHKVGYDEQRQLWYCDMELDTGHSYWPFVRLGLARYQPNSVTDAHLSRVVLADFAQLAPDRLATVIFDPDRPTVVAVTVCGPGYSKSGVGNGSSQFEVTVETRAPGVPDETMGWIPASTVAYPLNLTDSNPDTFTWSGGVTLPTDRGTKRYRLVIREYERFVADGAFVNPTINPNIKVDAIVNSIITTPPVRRLVYAAVLEI